MIRRPPRSTRTDTLFPYTTLFRSAALVGRELRFPILRQNALDDTLELGPAVAVEGGETVLPRLVRGAAARAGFTPGGQDIVRHDEGRIRPAELLAGRGAFFLAQRSEGRRVGKEGVSKCRSRWLPLH